MRSRAGEVMKKRFQLFICVQVLFKHILLHSALRLVPVVLASSSRGNNRPTTCWANTAAFLFVFAAQTPSALVASVARWLSTSVFNVSRCLSRGCGNTEEDAIPSRLQQFVFAPLTPSCFAWECKNGKRPFTVAEEENN